MKPLHLVIAYICLLHLGPILNLFGIIPGGRVFPITTAGHLLMVYLALRYFALIRRAGFSYLDLLVTAFVVWSLASFVLYFQKDNPSLLPAYAYGVHLYVMPIFGYFAIKTLAPADQDKALRFFLWSNLFVIVVGLYLWWARPDFYTVFLREVLFENREEWSDWMIYSRLQSYLFSTTLGVICALTVALVGTIKVSPLQTLLVLSAALPAVVLTYQRGGQAATLLALVYLAFWGQGSRVIRWSILGGAFVIAAIGMIVITANSDAGLEYYINRKEDYNSSVFEFRSGYTVGMTYITAFPLGVGLGGSGNAASGAGFQNWPKVVDANFMRIFADLGVQGLLLFLVILGVSFYCALRKRKNFGLACIMAIYAMVALGTNVFDGHLTPQLFWLFMGMADTKKESFEAEQASEPAPVDDPEISLLQSSKPS